MITPSRGITTTCGYSITMLFSIASQLMLASLTSAAIFFDPTAVKHSCVNEDGSTLTPGIPVHLTDVNTEASSQTILLKPILPTTVVLGASDTDTFMCVFHRWTMPLEDKQNGEGFYYALGRSVPQIPADVLGNSTGSVGDWARPPGRASHPTDFIYECGEASNSGTNFAVGEYLCEVTLPTTSKKNVDDPTVADYINLPYYLTFYKRSLTVRNEISRFLQKNTFGPTAVELDALETRYQALKTGSDSGIGNSSTTTLSHAMAMKKLQVEWVVNQMNPLNFTSGKFTSLREYWRRRLNPRKQETYRIGEAGPHPCEKHSRWRKFAFTHVDVQNSKMLRWGTFSLGGATQTQRGHRITVERVTYAGTPVAAPISVSAPDPAGSSSNSRSLQTLTSAPSMNNILVLGDMEGTRNQVLAQWLGTCTRTLVQKTEHPHLVYNGTSSLKFLGGRTCFLYRPMAPSCNTTRITQPIQAGDTIHISLKVRVEVANQVFQMYTGHYHLDKGNLKWSLPADDSHMISRTLVPNTDEWVTIEAVHKVGDDWKYKGTLLPPVECDDFHLRFRIPDSGASFIVDDVRMSKISSGSSDYGTGLSGFFANPNFEYSYQNWMYSSNAATLRKDPDLNRDVMVFKPGNILSQNILKNVVPGKSYRFRFMTKITNVDSVDMIISIRVKFDNNDLTTNGPCNRAICNFYMHPLRRNIIRGGGDWQEVITDQVTISNWTHWNGTIDFVSFEMTDKGMNSTGEYSVAGFEELADDYTFAPSVSFAPSSSPTNLVEDNVAYIVKYAGEVRTVINYPFQIDSTGEVLAMDGNAEYQLCDVDEVEGRKSEISSPFKLRFFINRTCYAIRHGNPTVNLDAGFINMTGLHILDLSDLNITVVSPINTVQTYGGDWLLKTPVQDEVCATFPNPYDNDYRGADPFNPHDIPSRFVPDKPVFAKLPDDSYALFDSRMLLSENSLENPLIDGGGKSVLRSTLRANRDGLNVIKYPWADQYVVVNDHNIALCANEESNFINRASCVLSYEENACVKESIKAFKNFDDTLVDVLAVIIFDDATLAGLHNASRVSSNSTTGVDRSRYIYAVDNLRWDDSIINRSGVMLPCASGIPSSRWIPRPDLEGNSCTNSLTNRSNAALVHALENSNDENQIIRDIFLWNSLDEDGCDEIDHDQYGMLVMTENEGCWENVHPDLLSIYDFTGYEARHAANTTVAYINNWTSIGIMQYPDYHPASYFEDLKNDTLLTRPVERYSYASTYRVNQGARYGDSLQLDQFADQLQLNLDPGMLGAMAKDLAELKLVNKIQTNRGGGTLMCGSPNEVGPDPILDDYFDVINDDLDCIGCADTYGDYSKQKSTVWAMNVLEGEDQFCQRMAWSLYEHLNVGAASNPDNTESNLYTYDIMIRHCFGNYFDIIKEMTYSPKMAEQFSFAESTSTRLAWDTSGEIVYPDENYAREIMQLFTFGLHELNLDGTNVLDSFGRVMKTYTNLDILSNARVMTGFSFTGRRGNVEELFRSDKSRQDPLRIAVDGHDFFPKSSLDGGWLGDRYPLCVDLPMYPFLKVGATFVFRGDSSLPTRHFYPMHWDTDESIKKFVLSPGSELYQALCNPSADGSCNFSNIVKLDSNLPCFSKECRLEDMVIVQVQHGAFYEYIRQPCVDLSFYKNPKKVITGFAPAIRDIGRRHTHAMCADPRTVVASRSCCGVTRMNNTASYNFNFEYHGERVTYGSNMNECTASGGVVCDPNALAASNPLVNIRPVYNFPYPSQNAFFWTNANCTQMVKVREDGMIAIIHKPPENPFFFDSTVPFVDSANSINFFSVPWEKDPITLVEKYPSLKNNCGNGKCTIIDGDCLCSIVVSETPAYNSIPSREAVLSLKVGAFNPSTFSNSTNSYTIHQSSNGVVKIYVLSPGNIGSTSTIFEVTNEFGEISFFKNLVSTITLGRTYSLRNPPSFMNLVRVELRDAEYEVDEFLTHLIRYRSSAPFISKKLIQYHGISNPSPGFVQRVSKAFISGSFSSDGITFGANKYGDLKAVAAAISLDPESLSPVVDDDPTSGNIREPLLKVMQILRSLTFQRRSNVKFRHGLLENMSYKIGQFVFDPPDQFSFFAHDYAPPGVFAETGLVSPESELLSMSSVVGIMNGFISLVDYGLANHDGGFGPYITKPPEFIGDYTTSVGHLRYRPSNNTNSVSNMVEELSTLMTAGRLSAENKQVMLDAHAYFNTNNGTASADRVLVKLFAATPEFHTSNTVRKSGSPRTITPPKAKSSSPYKAIVYVNLAGGVDSFNILTPGPEDCLLYGEYSKARGVGKSFIGLKLDEILPINGTSARISQCNTLGVNHLLPAYQSIFNEGSGVFFANMGHLHKPVTKSNWLTETRTDLFSHHTMRAESHAVDAFREGDGPGVLGRMLDILERQGHAVGATSINSRVEIIDGSPKTGRLADVMSTEGIPRIRDRSFLKGDSQQLRNYLKSLHSGTDDNSGVFSNAYSQTFVDIWNKTDTLAEKFRSINLLTDFVIPGHLNVGEISSQLQLVARLIRLRDLRGNGINRDVFYCDMGGFDAHFLLAEIMENKLPSLNHAISSFWREIKAQGLQNSVVVVQGSEFGRTITPNSNFGSDHGWGGNYFMFGGDVSGGKIMGVYPSFNESSATNIGRGRVMPTTSWDALFYGLTQWMGIFAQADIDYVLPNSQNFGCNLYTDSDLFKSGTQVLNGCGGASHETSITFQVPESRLLTGEEQKEVCKLAIVAASRRFDFDRSLARCYISDMTVANSVSVPGMYDVLGSAVMNFDGSGQIPQTVTSTITVDSVQAVAKVTTSIASDFLIADALPQSEAPSSSPSMQPSISSMPSFSPSISSMPSNSPTNVPSMIPSISSRPSNQPSLSDMPSLNPSSSPSVSLAPSVTPTDSEAPTTSLEPTPGPTARKVFEDDFISQDIGNVAQSGQFSEGTTFSGRKSGLYTIEATGSQIYGSSDSFHYMYLETSGDATFTVLIEDFEASSTFAKVGIMFRSSLSQNSSHYSIFQSNENGNQPVQQHRTCMGCNTTDYNTTEYSIQRSYSSVWLRVTKVGNVFKAFYKPSYLAKAAPWYPFGYQLLLDTISSNDYFVGVATVSGSTSVATSYVSNIQLTRTCSNKFITRLQCDQASNCESGTVSGSCYNSDDIPSWESLAPVANILDSGSSVVVFGCRISSNGNLALDMTTDKFVCDRTDYINQTTGLVIKLSHKRLSIAEGLRVYSSNECFQCDPTAYKLEGRVNGNSWVVISSGDLPWKNVSSFPRNSILSHDIVSTYASGDTSLQYVDVSFHSHNFETCGSFPLQSDYLGATSSTTSGLTCMLWPQAAGIGDDNNFCRNPDGKPGGAWCYTNTTVVTTDTTDSTNSTDAVFLWEYCDVPYCKNNPGALNAYSDYKITWTGIRNSSTLLLQLAEIEVPGLLGEEGIMPRIEFEGEFVQSVLVGYGSTADFTLENGVIRSPSENTRVNDRSTNKFEMILTNSTAPPGIVVSPSLGQESVVTGLRIYTANNNPDADPIKYSISGRMLTGANVKNTGNGKCWGVNAAGILMGNYICSVSDPKQKFYMSVTGDIRVKSLPGLCLDHRYGFYPEYYVSSKFIACLSDNTLSTASELKLQKFRTFNATQFATPANTWSSMFLGGDINETCLSVRANTGQTGGIYPTVCSGSQDQKFIMSGGNFYVGAIAGWAVISQGDLPWISEHERNPLGVGISSTYEHPDYNKYLMEVSFYDSYIPYQEYRIEFLATRTWQPGMNISSSTVVQFAELELPGLILGRSPVTSVPTRKPTRSPTRSPTQTPTFKPTYKPTTEEGLVINKVLRCGFSELDAREKCGKVCQQDRHCVGTDLSGKREKCFTVLPNFCGSIYDRIYPNPRKSQVTNRCGKTEIWARTFCGLPCTTNAQCTGVDETCLKVFDNYCGSTYIQVDENYIFPTRRPTARPTRKPTFKPTSEPTRSPTNTPTKKTKAPTNKKTKAPTRTRSPTKAPTTPPTKAPTTPPTKAPTAPPPTRSPTKAPTMQILTVSSGPINIHVPDNSAVGVYHSITVNLPAGAVICNVGVTINLSHTYMGDIDINLKAPNGNVLNLFNLHGGSGDNMVNTVISSQGTNALSNGYAPFTGTFRATGSLNKGPTAYKSNVASFADLYSVPSGTWTLALRDSVSIDVGPLTRWDITFELCPTTLSPTTLSPTNAPTFKPTRDEEEEEEEEEEEG